MRKPTILSLAAAALLLPAASPAAAPGASEWEIGPIIRGRNYSQAMPLRPQPTRTGWRFDFPVGDSPAAGHVHYVSYRPAPIAPGSRIIVRYRVDARAGMQFVPRERPDLPATVSLYFQRRGDNWSARGHYEFFRWYAPAATVQKLAPGEHEMIVRLDDPRWISVRGRSARSPASAGTLEAALADIDRIGLVFGSSAARGHGVYATAPARFTLLDFRIEPAGQGSRDVG